MLIITSAYSCHLRISPLLEICVLRVTLKIFHSWYRSCRPCQHLDSCSNIEFLHINTLDGQICENYLIFYNSVAGEYLSNPDATFDCPYCLVSDANPLLALYEVEIEKGYSTWLNVSWCRHSEVIGDYLPQSSINSHPRGSLRRSGDDGTPRAKLDEKCLYGGGGKKKRKSLKHHWKQAEIPCISVARRQLQFYLIHLNLTFKSDFQSDLEVDSVWT